MNLMLRLLQYLTGGLDLAVGPMWFAARLLTLAGKPALIRADDPN